MDIEIHWIRRVRFEKFADEHRLKLHIREHDDGVMARYTASFEGIEVKEGELLRSAYGEGNSIDAAMSDYKKQISGKLLVKDAWKKSRKEFVAPRLI